MSTARKEIALVITTMGCGGAERVMAALANHLADAGHRVTLHVLNEPELFYPLRPAIAVRAFSFEQAAGLRVVQPWQRVRWLRRRLTKPPPDMVITFIEVANILTLLALQGSGVPVVIAERTNPRRHRVSLVHACLRRVLYQSAARLVVQTEETAVWGRRLVSPSRVVVMPNPVWPASAQVADREPAAGRRLVAMGRLVGLKRFDLLIEVFASLAGSFPEWSLLILGEGPERTGLQSLADRAGIGDRVSLPGQVKDPAVWLSGCELFVFTSLYEGFPNALCEAMACGLPAVAFDCPTGPSEIIRDGVDGVLVKDGDRFALAAALARLMRDDGERSRLAARAPEVVNRFDALRVLAQWEALCHEVMRESGPRGRR